MAVVGGWRVGCCQIGWNKQLHLHLDQLLYIWITSPLHRYLRYHQNLTHSLSLIWHWLFQVNPDVHLDQFYHKVEFHDNYSTDGYDISYPGLIMKIHLKRNIGYQVMQTFVPSSLFVTLGRIDKDLFTYLHLMFYLLQVTCLSTFHLNPSQAELP